MTTPNPHRRRRLSRLAVVAAVVLLVALAAITIALRVPAIERDIERRAADAYLDQDRSGVPVIVTAEGRDVTIAGDLAADDLPVVEELVADLWGVGRVTFDRGPLTAIDTTTTTTAPPSTTTTAPAPTTTATSEPPGTTTTTSPPPAPILAVEDGVVSASVASPVTGRRIELGASRAGLSAEVIVEPNRATAPWAAAIDDALAALRGVAAISLTVDGDMGFLAGLVADEERVAPITDAFAAAGIDLDASRLEVASPPDAASAAELETRLNALVEDVSILFEAGSAEVSPTGSELLERAAELLRALPGARVEIGGHADDAGDAAANLALSRQRADAVADVLVAAGVDPLQITTVGYGGTRPVTDDTDAGPAANRRIEFTVEGVD